MTTNTPVLNDALYTYVFATQPYEALTNRTPFAGGVFSASRQTTVTVTEYEDRRLLLAGFCVDAHGEIARENLPAFIAENAADLAALLRVQDRLAGRYILLYEKNGALSVLGDAVSGMGIYYGTEPLRPCFASTDHLAADALGYRVSGEREQMFREGHPSYPLPGDLTYFEKVRCLLPNHYLDMRSASAVRYFPAGEALSPLTAEEAAEKLHVLLTNIARQYTDAFPFALPLTAGTDSRLMLAYLRAATTDLPAFSYGRAKDRADYRVDVDTAARLSKALDIPHSVLPYAKASDAAEKYCRRYLGCAFTPGLANWPCMFKKAFPDRTLYGGGIVDQIGKCGFGAKNVPDFCATPSYLAALNHFYGEEGRRANAAFTRELRQNAGGIDVFDLYDWEWFCARWGNRHSAVYALLSVNHLNLFNCREVIYLLLRVPRKARVRKEIHYALYEYFDPALTRIPINPASWRHRAISAACLTGAYQFFGVYCRYFARRLLRKY